MRLKLHNSLMEIESVNSLVKNRSLRSCMNGLLFCMRMESGGLSFIEVHNTKADSYLLQKFDGNPYRDKNTMILLTPGYRNANGSYKPVPKPEVVIRTEVKTEP